MVKLKPKEQHEQLLANVDKEMIVQHLNDGQDQAITKIAVILARQCHLFVHFQRLWKMRVSDLNENLSTERFMKSIYVNKRSLYKQLIKTASL
jgi:hypothetical protein